MDRMKKLRLLMTRVCDRRCEGCCNKYWDLDAVPVCTSYKGYEEVFVTGGEPMLYPHNLLLLLGQIYRQNKTAKRFLYTANSKALIKHPDVYCRLHGITLTLHEQSDVADFLNLDSDHTFRELAEEMSLHLNVFKGIEVPYEDLDCAWNVQDEKEWDTNCPLPDGEVLMRLKGA